MATLTATERAVLDSASDDYENLEQLYKSIALEFSSAAYQAAPDAFYWRAANPPVFLSEIADAVYRLSVGGFLHVRQEDGRVREDFRDASFVWRDWFRAKQEAASAANSVGQPGLEIRSSLIQPSQDIAFMTFFSDQYPMRGRIDAWLAGTPIRGRPGIESVSGTQALDIHIDELCPDLKTSTAGAAWLAPAIEAFGILYEALGSRRDRLMARLTVGLWADETINLNPPEFSRIEAELDGSPPELHVTDRELEKFYWPVEAYERPIVWPEVATRFPWARVTYRIWRAVRNDPEEFSRFLEVRDQPMIV